MGCSLVGICLKGWWYGGWLIVGCWLLVICLWGFGGWWMSKWLILIVLSGLGVVVGCDGTQICYDCL